MHAARKHKIFNFRRMKRFLIVFGFGILLFSCSTQKSAVKESNNSNTEQEQMEYGVETFDAKFKNWYEYFKNPAKNRSQAYYENWNRQYVPAWNTKCANPPVGWHFDPVVGYKTNEDYGFELNHELFYYFMYVENVLNIEIIQGGPTVKHP